MTIYRTSLLAGGALLLAGLAACDSGSDQASTSVMNAQNGSVSTASPDMIDLRAIENPQALQTADVTDRAGAEIGSVERIEVGADGRLSGLVIELDGGQVVRATPAQVRYDESESTVALMVEVDELDQAAG